MPSSSPLRSLRAALLGAALSLGALAGFTRDAGAQDVALSAAYSCGAPGSCSTVRFTVANTSTTLLELITLRLSSSNPAFAFAEDFGPNTGTFSAVDNLNPAPSGFGGFTQVVGSGSSLFIDFTEANVFPPFTLAGGSTGYVDVQLTATTPLLANVFTFSGELPGDGRIAGTVSAAGTPTSTVPEPSTYVLLATGLGTLGTIARRRRAA